MNAYTAAVKKTAIGKRTRLWLALEEPSELASSNIQFVETMGSKPRIAYYAAYASRTGSMTQFNFLVIIFNRPLTKSKTNENWISILIFNPYRPDIFQSFSLSF